jgi:hypothetical protein
MGLLSWHYGADAVRIPLSMVRLMEASYLPDISENQSTGVYSWVEGALRRTRATTKRSPLAGTTGRNEPSTKMWIAVDAIHSIGEEIDRFQRRPSSD